MLGKCPNCGSQEWQIESERSVHYDLPQLAPLSQTTVDHVCRVCGNVEKSLSDPKVHSPDVSRVAGDRPIEVEYRWALISKMSPSGSLLPTIQYPAVSRAGSNILVPTSEGNIQDGTMIDRYGKPDLMVEFAEEYLRQYRAIMPKGRLPNSLSEIMPAMLLLVTAAELSVKAYWIRSSRPMRSHAFLELYEELAPQNRRDIERRFANTDTNLKLSNLGIEIPEVKEILGRYFKTYGDGTGVYTDSRYYAEPTTMFSEVSGLRGASLVKGNIPYPIFLPDVVQSLIDAYKFYSGSNRLKRLGADLNDQGGERDNDNHGEWGLVPSSLGLVVVMVLQADGKGLGGRELETFTEFKLLHPTSFVVDWAYGGSTLLFYRDGGLMFPDGKRLIDGLECRLWSKTRLGMHARDLYLLADALDSSDKNSGGLGQLSNIGVESVSSA